MIFKPKLVNLVKFYQHKYSMKHYSLKSKQRDTDNIRNIGILAHIDAGKTTTTERMLYYSGTIKNMGEVHHGNTVTDFMEQERERGITITSAAVSFSWKQNQFNLIDTPGHIDFTMEVEQTLNVLDGAIVVLDASAGVEAQTLTVWRQANHYNLPKIIFVNKMDRADANLDMCIESVQNKLEVPTVALQMPINEKGSLVGIIDILSLERILFDGRNVQRVRIDKDNDTKLWHQVLDKRIEIVDKLSEVSDKLAEKVIESGSLENISTADIVKTIKKTNLKQKIVPILCGSAYKNIGIQPLMDSIIYYLPNPSERNFHFSCFDDNLSAKAFKVMHNKQRGALVFFRVYSGKFVKAQRIFNVQNNASESCGKLLVAYADEFKEVEEVTNGNIAVVTGLKLTSSGDLITSNSSASTRAKESMLKLLLKKKLTNITEKEIEDMFISGNKIPEPVFFCSIEPPSLAYQSALDQALIELQREDPSLRVTFNEETGQTVLAGMGELHLEIIKERIKREYKIEVDLGPLQIAYKEMPDRAEKIAHSMETKVGNSKHSVEVTLSLLPTNEHQDKKEILKLDKTPDAASNLANMRPKHLLAVKQGVAVALSHGPKVGCPLINTSIMLHNLTVGRGTSDTVISAAVTQCIQKLLATTGSSILEPEMILEIVTPEEYLTPILADITRRRSTILSIDNRGSNRVINILTPLAELMGYSTDLRTISSGTATFVMEFKSYKKLTAVEETTAIQNVRGF